MFHAIRRHACSNVHHSRASVLSVSHDKEMFLLDCFNVILEVEVWHQSFLGEFHVTKGVFLSGYLPVHQLPLCFTRGKSAFAFDCMHTMA